MVGSFLAIGSLRMGDPLYLSGANRILYMRVTGANQTSLYLGPGIEKTEE